MRSTEQLRQLWTASCDRVPLDFRFLAPGVKIAIHNSINEAVQALSCVFQAHGYHIRPGDTGAYNCRPITGGKKTSLHAHGIALDVNWNTNPYRKELVTDMPIDMIAAIERIKTKGGHRVWGWGGRYKTYKDAMHFEVVASPSELKEGIDWGTVAMPPRVPTAASTWPMLQEGDRGPTVRTLQEKLNLLPPDGVFGPKTAEAVRKYQTERGLKPDGNVGLQTWTAILTKQPVLEPGEPSPVKLGTCS